MTAELAPAQEAANLPTPSAEEYVPAAHTAAVIEDDAVYVVDLRDSRVLRLTGLAALAWERACGLVSEAELEGLIAETDADPEHILSGIRETWQTLCSQGLMHAAPR